MNKLNIPALFLLLSIPCLAQERELLLDKIHIAQLNAEPFSTWYQEGYSSYEIESNSISELRLINRNVEYEIYFGTWCGDSRREVPRFLKLLAEVGQSEADITLYGVDYKEGAYKQSPSKYERELGIYRVPTIRILKKDEEIGRIVEFPVQSLEGDLLSILKGSDYSPNYKSFPIIDRWLNDGTLSETNCSIRGLSNQLRNVVYHFAEINSIAHVLMDQGRITESLVLYRMNAYLFSDNASCLVMLARAYGRTGEIEKAMELYRQAWSLEPNDDDIYKELVALAGYKE